MSRGLELGDVFAMLDKCLPGHTRRLALHHWRIEHGGVVYPSLPKGAHGTHRAAAEIGHVRRMVRLFGIGPCAKNELPGL